MDVSALKAGPELDALVAEKVMGWHLSERIAGRGRQWLDSTGASVSTQPREKPPFDWDWDYFEPSTDIDSAFAVAEKVDLFSSEVVLSRTYADDLWEVMELEQELRHTIAVADTVPSVICRAALKAVGA